MSSEFDTLWDMLQQSFCDIHNRKASDLAFEQLYRASYKIVLRKKGPLLWEKVTEFERKWFAERVMPVIRELITSKIVGIATVSTSDVGTVERRELGEKFLRGLRDTWQEHQLAMNMITDILMYMDRNMTTESRKPSIFTISIGLYRDYVLLARPEEHASCKIFDIVNAVILDLVNMERRGDVVDRGLIRSTCSMLDLLYRSDDRTEGEKLYHSLFEPYYLQESRKFYAEESHQLLSQQDASVWLHHTQRRLDEEVDRCNTTLWPSTVEGITRVVEDELIRARLGEFLSLEGTGLKAMLDNDRREELSIFYRLLRRTDPKVSSLTAFLSKRIVELGLEVEKNLRTIEFFPSAQEGDDGGASAATPKPMSSAVQAIFTALKWVEDVLALKWKFDAMLEECFEKDLICDSAITKAFANFVNMFPRASEFISLYIDEHLKKGLKGKTDKEVEAILDGAITLFEYLQDRDLFERYYQKHLARRLLQGRSESEELEQAMIAKMKAAVGHSFTSKFEGMFKDMTISSDLRRSYKEHMQGLGDGSGDEGGYKKIDLNISVLTSNNWPADSMGKLSSVGNDAADVVFPETIQKLQESFLKYYSTGRNGRVLTWLPSVGHAEIRCTFPKIKETGVFSKERRYDLSVSTYGMIVVMFFNDIPNEQWVSLEEIHTGTKIPIGELQRTLGGLTIPPKSRIFIKEPTCKSIKHTDRFRFNTSFFSKSIKIKVPMGQASRVESKEERKETEEKNNETRANACSAAIVRIMKCVPPFPVCIDV